MNKYVFLIPTLFSQPVFATSGQKNKTIPFIYETTTLTNQAQNIQDFPGTVSSTAPTGTGFENSAKKSSSTVVSATTTKSASIEAEKVSELVSSIYESICGQIKKGSVRVWLKFDANAKILGVGTSSEGGIEVTISCK